MVQEPHTDRWHWGGEAAEALSPPTDEVERGQMRRQDTGMSLSSTSNCPPEGARAGHFPNACDNSTCVTACWEDTAQGLVYGKALCTWEELFLFNTGNAFWWGYF